APRPQRGNPLQVQQPAGRDRDRAGRRRARVLLHRHAAPHRQGRGVTTHRPHPRAGGCRMISTRFSGALAPALVLAALFAAAPAPGQAPPPGGPPSGPPPPAPKQELHFPPPPDPLTQEYVSQKFIYAMLAGQLDTLKALFAPDVQPYVTEPVMERLRSQYN